MIKTLVGSAIMLLTNPVLAVLSGETSRIHGSPPSVSGELQLLYPDGQTLLKNDDILDGGLSPKDFILSDSLAELTIEDADGDTGLNVLIDASEAKIRWFRDGTEFTGEQYNGVLADNFEGDDIVVETEADIVASSVTGMPTHGDREKYTSRYQLKASGKPVYRVNGESFSADSGFPKTGFSGAEFDIWVNGFSDSNNKNFEWTVNQSWLTVQNGRVTFIEPSSGGSAVITARNKIDDYTITFIVQPTTWFTIYPVTMDQSAGLAQCTSTGQRVPSRDEMNSGGVRQTGKLWAEWGTLNSGVYTHETFVTPPGVYSWTTDYSQNGYYTFSLISGAVTVQFPSTASIVTLCMKDY
ncbi:hypothetical protein A3462_05860 [Enterobacter bugandensis]|uniref:hypothetical protein n=1 Tax=Enterobacter bugandensis TaxID=881260 RepID=UPI0007B3DB50|nr:hypothetical protein [Enterobacter bugandensis]KZP65722.1 hypothetical protein A3462_05860 [Enterobacter bugandensis]